MPDLPPLLKAALQLRAETDLSRLFVPAMDDTNRPPLMTDTTRNLIIKLSSHMAYMQDKLEEYHHADSLQDHYWYRESVALRQQVADALAADDPAAPEGREPASVVGEPSDELVAQWIAEVWHEGTPVRVAASDLHLASKAAEWGARYGRQPAPPAEGEVGELVAKLRRLAPQNPLGTADPTITRAADLLEQRHPTPVPMSERLPGPEDCDAEGRCWWGEPQIGDSHDATWNLCTQDEAEDYCTWGTKCGWLPFTALPLPAFWDGDCDKTATSANQ